MTGSTGVTDNSGVSQVSKMSGSGSRKSKDKSQIACKFYTSPGGCRVGESCPYLHVHVSGATDVSALNPTSDQTSLPKDEVSVPPVSGTGTRPLAGASERKNRTLVSRAVPRPIPRAQREDPRGFEIEQLRRRYSPEEIQQEDGETVLKFKLVPSDPDFPYEISTLDCILRVPVGYAKSLAGKGSSAKLRLTNVEIPRGFQINVERGFDDIVERNPKGTLLQHLNSLDRELETLLAAPKAETIKIVANRQREEKHHIGHTEHDAQDMLLSEKATQTPSIPVFSAEEKTKAKAKREADTRQLEARMSRLPLYLKSLDGLAYTLPIEPRRRSELPPDMRAIKTIKLIVPELYNLIPCRIEFPGLVGEHLVAIQKNFETWTKDNPNNSLFALINRLTQNIHLMLELEETSQVEEIKEQLPETVTEDQKTDIVNSEDNSKSHVVVIPRPPEWSVGDDANSESEESEFDSEEFSSDDVEHEENVENAKKVTPIGPERGIMMSFPHLELYSIELLELVSLSITVKCNRCKEQSDATSVKNSTEDHSAVKTISCRKCANQMSIGYRMDLMHANCVRAGYLDLDGCTVLDMLPSYFLPTCTECSTPIPQPGVISVRGESTMAICRECHKRMSFRIPEVKFLQVSSAVVKAVQGLPRKRKENLGIKAGENLPNRGRCTHYAKSYRWFRFSCCNKVFPCDKCHDLASDHPNEHANRMICGHCSREQIFRPETCGICRASLIAKKGTGFWEGGKGTRDQVKMSRKDPRKYKRRGGNAPVGGK